MKATEARLVAALDRPSAAVRLFLLHGPDQAGAIAHTQRLAAALKGAERVDLDPGTLKDDPARLADEAASTSLFGDARWIRVQGAGEECVRAAELLLDSTIEGCPVVIVAPGVKASGKLVKMAIASPDALSFACYPPEGRQVETLALSMARAEGVMLSPGAARSLARASDGDRAIMAQEIAKLALFLDAAPDRVREADEIVLAQIGAAVNEGALGAIVAAVETRAPAALVSALHEMQGADASPIPWLRALQRRFGALAAMRADIDRGDGPEQVVKRHGVFWKEEAATIAALRHWTPARIAAAQAEVRRAERAAMSGGDAGRVVVDARLLAMAREPKG